MASTGTAGTTSSTSSSSATSTTTATPASAAGSNNWFTGATFENCNFQDSFAGQNNVGPNNQASVQNQPQATIISQNNTDARATVPAAPEDEDIDMDDVAVVENEGEEANGNGDD